MGLLSLGGYEKARILCDQLTKVAPEDYRGWRGCLLMETGQFTGQTVQEEGAEVFFSNGWTVLYERSLSFAPEQEHPGMHKTFCDYAMDSINREIHACQRKRVSLEQKVKDVQGQRGILLYRRRPPLHRPAYFSVLPLHQHLRHKNCRHVRNLWHLFIVMLNTPRMPKDELYSPDEEIAEPGQSIQSLMAGLARYREEALP